jgi:protein TonB
VAGRTYLIAISLGAHVLLGLGLAAIPVRARRELIAISMAETTKPKPVAKVDPPPPEPEKPAARAPRAKVAPPKQAPADAPPPEPASPSLDAVPDFGLSLSNGAGGGLAVPAPRPALSPAPATTAKTLTRAARAHAAADDCDEPPAKPKLLSRPTPAYTDDARAAGIAGKVRVEITVDEQGRVVSVTVLQGLGHGLDEAAVAAARGMTFEPAVRCGKRAAATFKVGFNFAPGTP